jgi:hypothetical protein
MAETDMIEDAEITLGRILRAISQLRDAELLQLRAAARKEAEKRGEDQQAPLRHGVSSARELK